MIALDVFKDKRYARDINERNGWISLLATESVEEAEQLMQVYPWLVPIYADIAAYRSNPQEVFSMYSEALRIMDQNSMQLMVDEMSQQIKELEEKNKEIIRENKKIISEKDNEIVALQKELERLKHNK